MLTPDDLQWAFDMNCQAGMHDGVYIHRRSGAIFVDGDIGVDQPEADLNDDDWIAVPDRSELDLGRVLVEEYLETLEPDVARRISEDFQGRRGAYRRLHAALEREGLRESWHGFEARATMSRLCEWCSEQGIELEEDAGGPGSKV